MYFRLVTENPFSFGNVSFMSKLSWLKNPLPHLLSARIATISRPILQ